MVVLPLLLRLLLSMWLLALRILLLNTLLAAPLLLLLLLRTWLLADAIAAAAASEFASAANVVVGTSAVAAARYRGSLPPRTQLVPHPHFALHFAPHSHVERIFSTSERRPTSTRLGIVLIQTRPKPAARLPRVLERPHAQRCFFEKNIMSWSLVSAPSAIAFPFGLVPAAGRLVALAAMLPTNISDEDAAELPTDVVAGTNARSTVSGGSPSLIRLKACNATEMHCVTQRSRTPFWCGVRNAWYCRNNSRSFNVMGVLLLSFFKAREKR